MVEILKALPGPTLKEFKVQSIEVEGTKKAGQTGHYRNPKWTDLKGGSPNLTIPDLFESGLTQAPSQPFLGHRPLISPGVFAPEYKWETYAEVDVRRRAVGSALCSYFESGKLQKGTDFEAVGIWAVNRPEWQIIDMACHSYNKVSVALYDTLGPTSVEYVIKHSELAAVFCSSNHVEKLINHAKECDTLKMIISLDALDSEAKSKHAEAAKAAGIEFLELSEVETHGAAKPMEPIKAELETVATVCYSSGTTGTPKGVVLTHHNIASAVLGHIHGLPILPEHPIAFSYLPLAHIYGRCIELIFASIGGRIGYYTGNPLNLLTDVQALKPHYFPAVPRVLNRIYQAAMTSAREPGVKGFLVRHAIETKLKNLRATGSTRHAFWDKIVFKKIQAVLGGQIACITSGSAPINRDTMNFFKIAFFDSEVLEGFGLTETCAFGTRTWLDDPTATGTIGGVAMANELKLIDIEELGYTANDQPNPRGELCFRGNNVFKRYYKDEENTSKALDADGWFRTGDVAEIDKHGRFTIIDRVKNIMKLSQGEYVALEKVENLYSVCPEITQIFVHGDSLQDYLVAVIVPEQAHVATLAQREGIKYDTADPSNSLKDPALNKAVLDNITAQVKASGALKGFEMVKIVHLTHEPFSTENDTMTPTFKIKRREAYGLHKEAIDAMYTKGISK